MEFSITNDFSSDSTMGKFPIISAEWFLKFPSSPFTKHSILSWLLILRLRPIKICVAKIPCLSVLVYSNQIIAETEKLGIHGMVFLECFDEAQCAAFQPKNHRCQMAVITAILLATENCGCRKKAEIWPNKWV